MSEEFLLNIRFSEGSLLRQRGAAREFAQGGVADILEVGDANFAGVEAVAGEIAQEGEEGDSLAERGIFFGVLAVGDQVEDFFLLLWRALYEDVAITIGARAVQPEEPAAELQLILGIFAGEQIDEFGGAGFHRAAGFFVLGDDGVAEEQERGVLRDGKIFWGVGAGRGGGFFLVDHLVDVLGGFGGDDLQDGAGGRAEG